MSFAYFILISFWFGYFWLLGRAMLPLARRVFPNLPDSGLAAGRVLFLSGVSLFAYWGAALHLVPLTLVPLWLFGLPVLCWHFGRGADFGAWAQGKQRALLGSELVFGVSFAFFLWVRLRHPELNDLEKLMDSALLGALMRSRWLPVDNPWFHGSPLTSYYHFGPLLGALPARSFGLSVPFAYNLVQPLFCALFISTFWAVGAALTGSLKRGLFVVFFVALLGHFEPVRQWVNPGFSSAQYLARLDWWSTSRVFPDTTERLASPLNTSHAWAALPEAPWTTNADYPWFAISEYPIFTMIIGDAHAHFYAFSLAALLFSLCWALFAKEEVSHRRTVLILLGVLLGIFLMTNTWDVPLYAILVLGCAALTARGREMLVPFPFVVLSSFVYLLRFRSQVSGAVFEVWPPASVPFLLFWGAWLVLWLLVLFRMASERRTLAILLLAALLTLPWWPLGAIVVTLGTVALTGTELWASRSKVSPSQQFALLLGLCGLLAIVAPQFFYMRGIFGDGGLRHQDTVFKFGLQGWLLLGTAASASGLAAWQAQSKRSRRVLAAVGVLGCIVPALCAGSILWTRVVRDAPRNESGNFLLSMDGARFLPPSDRKAIDWLHENAAPGEAVLEGVGQNEQGEMGGDFSTVGRVSALSGVATTLGWPQHVWMWGEKMDAVRERWEAVRRIYAWPSQAEALNELHMLGVRYVFVGEWERRQYDAKALRRLREALPVVFEQGETFIARVPDQ